MGLLAPAFLAALAAISIPVLIHMIHRERRETIAFPSLMFLRKIPYRSVRRQKLRHLLLLSLRCLAIVLMAAAFARPFFQKRLAVTTPGSDARDVVILLDRSYSMAHGGRWSRAVASVSTIARDVRSVDRVTLVTFAAGATQVTEPTNSAQRIAAALGTLKPGSEPTRYAAGLRMAAQILGGSDLPRKEIVLISDYHRFGWSPSDEAPLPAGTVVKTVDVSRREAADLAVAHVAVARSQSRASRTQASVTARVTNLGATASSVDATLELAGRDVGTRRVTVPARSSAQVVFTGVTVPAAPTRGIVRIAADAQPSNDAFYFVTAEEAGASALIVEPGQARANQSLYVARALSVADDPAVRVDVKAAPTVKREDLRGRSLIVLNEAELSPSLSEELRNQVTGGTLLLIAPGDRRLDPGPGWGALLPASAGAMSDRAEPAAWTTTDFSSPLFEPFRAPGVSDFSAVTASRYRVLTPAESAHVLARFDDGAPLLVERASPKGGRVLLWATSLDAQWTNLPFHPLWVPFVHQLARRSMQGKEAPAWFTVPHSFDLGRASQGEALVESPTGERIRVPADSVSERAIELRDRGFYEVRSASTAIGAGRPVAVNVDLAESDLSHFDPTELVASLTARSNPGDRLTAASATPEERGALDLERQQSIWWYLLLAGVLLLAAETLFANRISKGVKPASLPALGVGSGRT